MTIPTASNFPVELDTNQNLYQVNDALRVRLIEDYNPGDTIITVLGDEATMRLFDETGIITLTDQCNDPEYRAISFYYGLRTLTTFEQLEILPGFKDASKPKELTNVTQNVMAVHHNALKDSLIAIENFAGKKNETPIGPLKGTMEQRVNYLRNMALVPKAWFRVNKNIGLAPLTVEFEDQSFRLANDGASQNIQYLWDFGDNTGPSVITIEEENEVPSYISNVLVSDPSGGKIIKTYTQPGIYDVTLTVTNEFGSDSVTFQELVTARFPAPDLAIVEFIQRAGQIVTPGSPTGGPYTTFPKIRTPANSIVDITINEGINSYTDKTYGGETVDGYNNPIDPIVSYTWDLSDDLSHNNSSNARAVFSIGGTYDLHLRVDTSFGSYRITSYEDSIDVVEKFNLWLWNYNDDNTVSSFEFGLISETFKAKGNNSLNLNKNESFLDGQVNEVQQKREFNRNSGFAQRSTTSSGLGGTGLLYWASGRDAMSSASTENILMSEFNGFLDTYSSKPSISRPWNWVGFSSPENIYFFLGGIVPSIDPFTSPTNQTKNKLNLSDLSLSSITFPVSNYKNGANELINNEVAFDVDGLSEQGEMSVYRSTWHNDAGYLLRNEGVGDFFRLKSFYKTSGNSAEPFLEIRKLPNVAGNSRTEGQLTSLSQGVYLFSNSGSVAAYNPISGVWATGGPGINSSSFRSLQDSDVLGFDEGDQSLLVASDNDKLAFLSFDYSNKTFIRFNELDTTFSSVSSRPIGEQWQMSIF